MAQTAVSSNLVPELSIITVTYNSAGEIEDFVRSLDSQQVAWNLWLVDNASKDETCDKLVAIAARDDRIRIVLNAENIGLAAANNQPIESLHSEFTAIVNPDVVLQPLALRSLVDFLASHRDVVAVGPLNVDHDGTPHSSFHRAWGLRHLLVWRVLPGAITRRIYHRVRHYAQQDVLFVSGACIVMHTEDYKAIGGYDPKYFLTVEDVCDLCIRLRRGDPAKRVVMYPEAKIVHLKARSAIAVPFVTLWYGAFGSIYHFTKHRGRAVGATAFAILAMSSILRALTSALRGLFDRRRWPSARNNLRVVQGLLRNNPMRDVKRP